MRRPAGRARPRRQNRSRSALGMAVECENPRGPFPLPGTDRGLRMETAEREGEAHVGDRIL